MPKSIDRLDLMIAYSCNISCVGCISLSDFKRDGIAPYDDIIKWIDYWSQLISPKVITVFGGEPCLHPKLIDICQQIRQHWPNTVIRLITNGYLLTNFDSASWFNFMPMEIQVSIHRADHEQIINQEIKKILLHRKDWQISRNQNPDEHEQLNWQVDGFKIYKSIFKDFVVPFKQVNGLIKPWMSNVAEAHNTCGAPNTPILYKGRLYKCPAVANAIDLSKENWFNYHPCEDATNLDEFINNIGQPEAVCGQCPDRTQAVIIDHFNIKNVTVKQKNIN